VGFSHLLRVPQDERPEGPSPDPSRSLSLSPARRPAHVFTLAADCGRSPWFGCLFV